ncbi:MAG TPA: zf-HC2 domain-containing protein [Verrucomicrobiae bacterium]|nr:zf-HC2 domain-containing protein [Verrucomicrobiae bacterium]
MNPCPGNKQNLAWLALDELPPQTARELRAHVDACPGCRQYLAEITQVTSALSAESENEATATATASAAFHQNVLRALQKESQQPAWLSTAARLRKSLTNWRVAVPLTGVAALVIAFLAVSKPVSHLASTPSMEGHPTTNSAPVVAVAKTDLAPTAANYRLAVSRSLDSLDDLLTRQANQSPAQAPVYTASMLAARAVE